MFDTGLADRIRRYAAMWGLPIDVVEVDGWRTRGRAWPKRPTLAIGHHTANPNMGWAPSLGICTNGRGGPNPVPGPLCNGLLSRIRSGRYTVFVVAAGVANHAGKGGYAGLTGNSSAWGLEIENNGTTEAWTELDEQVAACVLAAMLDGSGHIALEHKDWAPGRKSDRHHIDGNRTRHLVEHYLTANPLQEDFMAALTEDEQREMFQRIRDIHGWAATGVVEKTLRLVQEHVANPATGGGAGQIDWARLEQELDELKEAVANELAERLKA